MLEKTSHEKGVLDRFVKKCEADGKVLEQKLKDTEKGKDVHD